MSESELGDMNRKLAARCLAELGNLTRLDIYRLLVRAGPAGLNIGDIQTRLDIPASTLAFHLRGLINVDLVAQEKIGREVICRVKHRQLTTVIEFLLEECCKGFDEENQPAMARRAG
jgi:DNA-binding transcriptional ArsR family regulator